MAFAESSIEYPYAAQNAAVSARSGSHGTISVRRASSASRAVRVDSKSRRCCSEKSYGGGSLVTPDERRVAQLPWSASELAGQESNLQLPDPKSGVLPIELPAIESA